MKKKTRFKLSNSLLVPFCSAILVCLIGVCFELVLFYNSFFRALTKLNEEPIATITFKYKTAQRKFLDRVVWDRLRQNSPVYNGDTIHTSALSEATVWFTDGNVMDLSENTMAQVFLSEDKLLRAELSDGFAVVDSSESQSGITLASGGVEVEVGAGSALSAQGGASYGEGGIAVQVIKGNASVKTEDGSSVSVAAGEELSVSDAGTSRPSFTVTEPAPNSRILYHTAGTYPVRFNWKSDAAEENASFMLRIYSDNKFTNLVYETEAEAGSPVTVDLENGKYFWKIIGDGIDASGKFQLIQSLPPSFVAPVKNYSYSYRTRNPAVRLIWTESAYATAYRLEISDSPLFAHVLVDQRSSTTSSIISTLGEGEYWWRVTPFYTINRIGFTEPSEPEKFVVEKKGSLEKPVQLVPVEAGIVNTEPGANDIYFSWKMEDEAVKYNIRIADNPDLARPAVSEFVSENYFTMGFGEKKLKDGRWYWSVSQIDAEGNESELSAVRSFFALKGKPEQHTIEPSEGFRTSASLMPDLRFTWKCNLPENFETTLQIATDVSFRAIIVSKKEGGTNDSGFTFAPGTYYWRLVSSNGIDGAELVTAVKSFSVLENLAAAELSEPAMYKVVARETTPVKFEWQSVAEADYYKFAICKKNDGSVIYEDTVYGTSAEVNMYSKKFADKCKYTWQVQAQASAVPGVCSRRAGKIAEKEFFLYKLRPIEIVSPEIGSSIKGDDAVLNPSVAQWRSVDEVKEAQFVLYKTDTSPAIELMRIPSAKEFEAGNKIAPSAITLDVPDGLRPGNYEIIVYAKTLDDIDISNKDKKYRGKFKILPIEPLPSPQFPVATPKEFDTDYLRVLENPREIVLSWNAVKDANEYHVSIQNDEGRILLYNKTITEGTSYKIDFEEISDENRSAFFNGKFKWNVVAVLRIDRDNDGIPDKILKESPAASGTFSTNIPPLRKPKAKEAANPYGN